MENLEDKVKKRSAGKAMKRLAGTALVASLGFAAGYGVGGMKEAREHGIEKKLFLKEKVELIMQGYTPAAQSDHEGYLVHPTTKIDSTGKTFQYNMQKDSIDFGPVRQDGKIGYTLPERTEQEIESGWNNIKEYGQKIGKTFDDQFQGTKETIGEKWNQIKQYFGKEEVQTDSIKTP